mgnify:CR=1 FL=1
MSFDELSGFELVEDDSSDDDTTKVTDGTVTLEIKTGDDGKIEFEGVSLATGDLIALLPTALAHHVAQSAGLQVYRAPMPVPTVQLCTIWHRGFSASAAHVWLREQIADLLAPLDEET